MVSAEEIAKKEMELLDYPEMVSVAISLSCINGILLPRVNGERQERAVFKTWTYGDDLILSKACKYKTEVAGSRTANIVDINEMKRLMVKRSLMGWSLPIEIERENGWMTKGSYRRVSEIPAPIIDAFIYGFEKTFSLSDDDYGTINRQCAILFSQNSRGVSDACDAISMFCSYGSFSDKFGLKRDDLTNMPYKEYQMLRAVMSKEGEAMKRNSSAKDNSGNTRIAGPGGRIRQSRGKRVAM